MPRKSKYKIAIEKSTGGNVEDILRAILPKRALKDLGRKRLRIDESHAVGFSDKNKKVLRYCFYQGGNYMGAMRCVFEDMQFKGIISYGMRIAGKVYSRS